MCIFNVYSDKRDKNQYAISRYCHCRFGFDACIGWGVRDLGRTVTLGNVSYYLPGKPEVGYFHQERTGKIYLLLGLDYSQDITLSAGRAQ